MDVQRYYDDFSRTYDDQRGLGYHAMIDDIEASLVREHLRPGSRVLEIGCGTGQILRRLNGGSFAMGIDLSREMLAPAREMGLNVVHASALELPFEDGSFDMIYSFKVLAHVQAIEVAIKEAARVVRPGGVLALEFYNPLSLRYLVKRAVGPRQTGHLVNEADVPTRWDLPWKIKRYFPADVDVECLKGVRVLTPAALALRLPLIGRLMPLAEQIATHSSLAWLAGGFVVAVARKR